MGLNWRDPISYRKNNQAYIDRVGKIMKNHSGIGVKRFKFAYYGSSFDTSKLNSWLEIAVSPGIEQLEISLCLGYKQEKYNFPCSLLFAGDGGNSIQSLDLSGWAFRPMAGLGCLTRLHLSSVHITEDELGCLLSNSFALEELRLSNCSEIVCLAIPCLLHRFVKLSVSYCSKLEVIENKAPNLCTACLGGDGVHTSIGDSVQVKDMYMFSLVTANLVYHARAKLPASMPNLKTLIITSAGETFRLEVVQTRMKHNSVLEDPSDVRQMPGHRHESIKKVEIIGFCSAKSMVELTCDILENATSSLECLTLDTILYGNENGLSDQKYGKCPWIRKHVIVEAHKALLAIERYVVGKVPSRVKLNVKKPCSRCHVLLK